MRSARFLLLFTVVVWGWTFVATKVCLGYIEPVELLGLRLFIGLPILAVVIVGKGIRMTLPSQGVRLAVASGIIAAHFLIQITGIKYTSATNTGWIISVTPLATIVLSFILLREKIRGQAVMGVVVATSGILFLVSRGNLGDFRWLSSVGDWLVFASAHTWAFYTIATRDLSRQCNPLAVTFMILLPVAVLVAGYMIIQSDWSLIFALPPNAVIALLFLGVCGTALGHWFWQKGVARLGAAEAGIFLYLEPLATTALAVPYLHESFGTFTAIGGAMVLVGVWLAQHRTRRPVSSEESPAG